MKKTVFTFTAIFILFTASFDSVYAQEPQPSPKGVEPEVRGSPLEVSSTNIKLIPSQERVPQSDHQPFIPPEYFVPPIGSPSSSVAERKEAPTPPSSAHVSGTSRQFKAPLITSLERGKWYVQIGAYARAVHVEDAVNRAGSAGHVVIHSVGTDEAPMFRVLLGPFSQSESKTALQRFKNKGYDAFLRSGN